MGQSPLGRNGIAFTSRCGKVLAALVGLMLSVVVAPPIFADPTRFWISTSSLSPAGPETPSIGGVNGSIRFLHFWAQPATVNAGVYNAATNPFRNVSLENISLNLVTDVATLDFLDDGIVVYNPLLNVTTDRFGVIHDSSTGLASDRTASTVLAGMADLVPDIQGFTIPGADALTHTGIGPTCRPGDPHCAMTVSNGPAWLIASVAAQIVQPSGDVSARLQIGTNGLNYHGEESAAASVVFGTGSSPIYNAGTNRDVTLSGDAADFMLQPAASAVDQHWSGGTGQWGDGSPWGGSLPAWTTNAFLDANLGTSVVAVSGAQHANNTTVNGGRLQINANSTLAGDVTINAGGTISGTGSIDANLTLDGKFALFSGTPLTVIGKADVSGGLLGLLDSYKQPSNTTSQPFVALKAFGGIQGTLSNAVNSELSPGLLLHSIVYGPQTITIQIRSVGLMGDFNRNGTVDAADYTVWRDSLGQLGTGLAADGSGNGQVDAADYNIWKTNFGMHNGSVRLMGDFNDNGTVDAADYTVWRDSLGQLGAGLAADGSGNGQVDTADYNIWKSNFGHNGSGSGAPATSFVPEPSAIGLLLTSFAVLMLTPNFRRLPRTEPWTTNPGRPKRSISGGRSPIE